MDLEEAMDAIAQGVEILGILTLVLGLAVALVRAGLALAGSLMSYRLAESPSALRGQRRAC